MNSINGLFPGKIEPTRTVAGCIDIFENAWPNPQETITTIEKECENSFSGIRWTKATTLDEGINQNQRTNYHLGITHHAEIDNNSVCQNIHNQMYVLLLSSTIPYAEKHSIKNMFHESYNMLKYSGGQEYKKHADGGTDTGRNISAICYLNNDFSGGQLEFPNFGITINPEPGMLIIFPSNYAYAHIAHPVTDGTKYALVTWIKDRAV